MKGVSVLLPHERAADLKAILREKFPNVPVEITVGQAGTFGEGCTLIIFDCDAATAFEIGIEHAAALALNPIK